MSCSEAVNPGVPSSTMRHVVAFGPNVSILTTEAETVNAEVEKGMMGLVKVARTTNVELATDGFC